MASRRGFGRIKKHRSGRYGAAYVGPDLGLHWAPDSFTTKGDAEAWLGRERELLLHSPETWRPPKERHAAAFVRPDTLATYAEAWLTGRDLKPRTRALYRRLLDRFILPPLGDLRVKELTPALVRTWHAQLGGDHPTQTAHAYSLLRAILNTAVEDELLVTNPCRIRGGGQSPGQRKLEPPTLDQLAAAVDAMPPRLQALVLLAAWCGLRFGELAELRRGDVDLERLTLNVSRAVTRVDGKPVVGTPKSHAGIRSVTVPPHLAPMLEQHLLTHVGPDAGSLLFPSFGDPNMQLHHQTLYRSWERARKAAGRPELRIHDLRHHAAVMAAQTGATLAEIMDRLGHSTPQAAMRYQHAANDRRTALAAALSELAKGPKPKKAGKKGKSKRHARD